MKRSAIVLHAQDAFKEPSDAADATQRVDRLQLEILQIEDVLKVYGTGAPPDPTTGDPIDARVWRKSLQTVKEQKSREREQLKIWLRLQVPLPAGFLPEPRKLTELQRILLRASTLLRKLEEQGVGFSPSERAFLTTLREVTDIKPERYLDEVRTAIKGHVQNLFRFGGYLAMITKNEADLIPLLDAWRVLAEATPLQEEHLYNSTLDLVDVLITFDRYEEAIAHARTLDENHRDAPYLWMRIALAKKDPELLTYTRDLGDRCQPEEREWFFLRLYDQGGDLADTTHCDGAPGVVRSVERSALYTSQLIHAHLKWNRTEEARALLKDFVHTERRAQGLAHLFLKTHDDHDLDLLEAHVWIYSPTKLASMIPIIQALASGGRFDPCFELLHEDLPWDLRCAGYGILSRFLPDRAHELLDQATELVLGNTIRQTIEHVRTLYVLVHSEVKSGRIAEAVRLADLIHDKHGRSRVFLLLYALDAGIPLPSFLED